MNRSVDQPIGVSTLLHHLWGNRSLIVALTRREVEGRYKGSLLGIFWSFLSPLLMLGIFTFVFGGIFQAKWSSAGANSQAPQGQLDFACALFIGLLLYNFFAECISKAPHLVTNQPNYVKKIVFPLEILAVVTVLAALFHFLIAYAIVIVLIGFSGWSLHWSALYAPVVMLPFFMLVLGITWGLSSLGVYLRDIGQIISPALTAVMFLSPIFYPLSSVHAGLLQWYLLNPLTWVVEQSRRVLLLGLAPDGQQLLMYWLISLSVAYLGFVFFQKTRQGFSDVL